MWPGGIVGREKKSRGAATAQCYHAVAPAVAGAQGLGAARDDKSVDEQQDDRPDQRHHEAGHVLRTIET